MRVLLTGAEETFLSQLKEYLEEKKFSVFKASSIESTLEIIEKKDIKIIISEYKLAQSDGLKLLEKIKEKDPNIPFILLTEREALKNESLETEPDRIFKKYEEERFYQNILPNFLKQEIELSKKEKKLEETKKLDMKEKRRTLLDNLPGIALILEKGSREIVFSNDTAKKDGAFPGETCYETVADREDPCPFCEAPKTWEDDEHREIEVEYEGTYYHGIWIPYSDDLYIHYIYDITERKEKEEKIRKSKEKIQELHELSKKLLTSKSEEEVFKLAVNAVENVLDFDKCSFAKVEDGKFIVKESTEDLLTRDYSERPIEDGGIDTRTYREQESFIIDDIEKNKDAKPVNGKSKSAISIPIGEYGVFQAVSTEKDHFSEEDFTMAKLLVDDVTSALKRLEMREREDFVHSILRHDVGNKNVLAKGYLQMLEDQDLTEEVEAILKKTESTIDNSLELIEKVKTLRESEYEDTEKIDLYSILNDAEEEVLSETHSIDLEVEKVNNLKGEKEVKAGPMLKDILTNILENSVKYADCEKIKTSLKLSKDEEKVICSIEDDGKGISDEKKEKLFQKGYTTDESRGTGLGLYLAKKLIEIYGGDIKVKDSELGGARFDIILQR